MCGKNRVQNGTNCPLACGNYGICRNAQCSCPVPKSINGTNYFKRTNDSLPDRVGAP